jgi:N-acetylneuraminic acid mutarotase
MFGFSDTWAWNGSRWVEVRGNGPSARILAAMAGLNDQVVLFGGEYDLDSNEAHDATDTWTWDGSSWTQVAIDGPTGRECAAVAPLDGKIVLFGGLTGGGTVLSDTWTWDGSSWTQMNVKGPTARMRAAMSPLNGKLVLFGGSQGGEGPNPPPDFADTWTWDGTVWSLLNVAGPSGRDAATMAPLGGKLVLFGGESTDGGSFADTWTWDGTAWAQLTPPTSPPGRSSAVMATLRGEVVVFGGAGAQGALSDTWTWNGVSWTQQASTGPPARFNAMMASL